MSRAMAREALQVLHQKRLVRLQPRVEATVRPVEQWDVFDAAVIGWRLEVAPRFQMRSLTEMRQAIEPGADRRRADGAHRHAQLAWPARCPAHRAGTKGLPGVQPR
jgi:DNA-binding FadR family transcriptional regulator